MSTAIDLLSGGNALLRHQFGATSQGDMVMLKDKNQPSAISCKALVGRDGIRDGVTQHGNLRAIVNIPVTIDKGANPQLVAILNGQKIPEDWTATYNNIVYGIGASEMDASGYMIELEATQ